MKRRIKAVLAVVAVVTSLWVVTPSSALACDRYPCPAACKVNPPAIVHEDGTVTVGDEDLLVCYY